MFYYDVNVCISGSKVGFYADAVILDKNGDLRVYSDECGNVGIRLHDDDTIFIRKIDFSKEGGDA